VICNLGQPKGLILHLSPFFYLYLFKYYLFNFFYKDCIFPKNYIFQFLGKEKCRERNSKKKIWEMEDVEKEIIY
jgi:hypothetical protein